MAVYAGEEADTVRDRYEDVENVTALSRRQHHVEFTVTCAPVRIGDTIVFETVDDNFLVQPLKLQDVLWEWEDNAEMGHDVSIPTEMARGMVNVVTSGAIQD